MKLKAVSTLLISIIVLGTGCMNMNGYNQPVQNQDVENGSTKDETIKENLETTEKSILIQTNNSNLAQQDIYDNKVVWSGGNVTGKSKEDMHILDTINYYDLTTGKITLIAKTRVNGQTDETQVNDEWVSWTDWNDPYGSDWTIYAYSFSSKKIIEIDSSKSVLRPEVSQLPRLSLSNSNYLAWISEEWDENKEFNRNVILYDLNKNEKKIIAKIDNPQALPFVSDNYLAWNSENEIFIYSIKKGDIIKTIPTSEMAIFPKMNNDVVTWQEGDTLYSMPLMGNKKELIYSDSIFSFDVGEKYIVFQSKSSVFVYNIINKSIMKYDQTNAMLPYIRNDDLIWQESQGNMTNLRVIHLDE